MSESHSSENYRANSRTRDKDLTPTPDGGEWEQLPQVMYSQDHSTVVMKDRTRGKETKRPKNHIFELTDETSVKGIPWKTLKHKLRDP